MTASRSERIDFVGADGDSRLAARLDLPAEEPRAYALFAHCFTCGKDIYAASQISERLTRHGFGVLRFDFTGIGASEGEFANTDFASNIGDLLAAVRWMRSQGRAPAVLVGHSLGGTAVLAAAGEIPEARAVCTLAAPAEPGHVRHLFTPSIDAIETRDEAEVRIAGRPFRVRKEFLADIEAHALDRKIGQLRKALLVFHGPRDEIVGIDSATRIFVAARHPKSFVSLDDADHLLSRRSDAEYVADVIAAWARRYLPETGAAGIAAAVANAAGGGDEAPPGAVTVAEAGRGRFAQHISVGGRHHLLADEPDAAGGTDTGPSPYDLVLAGLGACTTMTLRMYAEHKQIPLERAAVTLRHAKIHARDCEECETREGRIDTIDRDIALTGRLTAEQRQRLLEIAEKCPVHRTLHAEVRIRTRLAG
jgi:putative redox protein